jgi:undecaprenyl-diphosphatase
VLAGGIWSFVGLGSEVNEGETTTVDERLLSLFRTPGDANDPIGSRSVESAVRDVTALGSLTVLGLLTLAVGTSRGLPRDALAL